jgi:hypothetical protein
MLRRVALVRTDVSEELSASFIRVTRIGELGTTLAVTYWLDPFRNSLLLRKCGSAGNQTRDLCICSQELWPWKHWGGRVGLHTSMKGKMVCVLNILDRLCGLVVKLPGCRLRGPGFDSQRCQIFLVAVGLERSLLSLVRINEGLIERKAPV